MKVFGFYIIRAERMADIHRRNKTLDSVVNNMCDELQSRDIVIKRQEEDYEILKGKCALVGLSKLQNENTALRADVADLTELVQQLRTIRDEEKLPGNGMQGDDGKQVGILPDALVSTEDGDEERHLGIVSHVEPS